MKDIIIIGAGPAGLTAAIYALRAGKSVMLLEAKSFGGQIINSLDVENYPGIAHISGFDLAMSMYEQAVSFGAEIVYEAALRIEARPDGTKAVHTAKNVYEARAVILATGAKSRAMGIERETELIGRGVSYCATCDGMFFRGKDVAVYGGGSRALEDAAYLTNYCSKVYVIAPGAAFDANDNEVEKIRAKENAELVTGAKVTKLIGEEKLSAVEVTDAATGDVRTIEIAGLFVVLAQVPDNGAFADVVDLDPRGYVASGEDCRTKTAGVYTAGDCRAKTLRQLTTAAADGAVAAIAAVNGMK